MICTGHYCLDVRKSLFSPSNIIGPCLIIMQLVRWSIFSWTGIFYFVLLCLEVYAKNLLWSVVKNKDKYVLLINYFAWLNDQRSLVWSIHFNARATQAISMRRCNTKLQSAHHCSEVTIKRRCTDNTQIKYIKAMIWYTFFMINGHIPFRASPRCVTCSVS